MAKAYDNDRVTQVDVPALSGNNTFTGTQTFIGNVNSSSTSTGTVKVSGGVGVTHNVVAGAVYNAVWNDLVDCIEVPEEIMLEPGYAYCFDGKTYYKSTKYLDDGFIGIHSDTAGFVMGDKANKKQLKAGVAGFILAYVDRKDYPVGTPLTVTKNGCLTAIKPEDSSKYSYKIVATFWKKEPNKFWGPENKKVIVNGRCWVKVK